MTEFKFFCPRCGRHIQCDTGYCGSEINCPACQQPIMVPTVGHAGTPRVVESPSKAKWKTLFIVATTVILVTVIAGIAFFLVPELRGKPTGLVGWWRAEGNAQDSVGHNDGTLLGGAGFAAGKVGEAFSFNGTSSCVSIPDSPLLDSFTDRITIELWLKSNQLTANANWEGIVTKGNSSWRLLATTGEKSVYFAGTGLSKDLKGHSDVNDGQWHHIAAVYDGTHIYLYVDGRLDASTPATGEILQNSYPMGIGYNAQGVFGRPDYFYKGLVDEVSLYHRALSAHEIAAIYRAGASGKFQ
jgi:hypothetical protein